MEVGRPSGNQYDVPKTGYVNPALFEVGKGRGWGGGGMGRGG